MGVTLQESELLADVYDTKEIIVGAGGLPGYVIFAQRLRG